MEKLEKSFYDMLVVGRSREEVSNVLACNEVIAEFGLALTEKEAGMLVEARNESLVKYHRIEFGKSILDKLVVAFCDSQYIEGDDYAETLIRLQDMFYQFKNEAEDELTDEELITFMREQFEEICFGDIDYLAETCLPRFAKAIRAGYRGFQESGGKGEYSALSEEARWDKNLYLQTVKELFWG